VLRRQDLSKSAPSSRYIILCARLGGIPERYQGVSKRSAVAPRKVDPGDRFSDVSYPADTLSPNLHSYRFSKLTRVGTVRQIPFHHGACLGE
jgi:hypothetical protein